MPTPIKAGDLCEVINGATGKNSPNLGLIVKVIYRDGEHTVHGPIWLCQAEYAITSQPGNRDISKDCAHFAQSWLRKIEPPAETKDTQTNVSKEVTA